MSIINKMLRDLDKRHAPFSATGPATQGMSQHAHAVAPRAFASDFFWRFMAGAMLFAVAWVAWVVWQLMPRPIVTDLAYQNQPAKAVAAPSISDPAPPRQAAAVLPATPKPEPGPAVPQSELRHAAARDRADHSIPQRRASASRSVPKTSGSPAKIASAQPRAEESATAAGKIDRRPTPRRRTGPSRSFAAPSAS